VSVSDASNLALAVLTALGLIIALLTFRRSLAGRARLDMSLGSEILLHNTKVPELILTADFSFINKGALPGIITEISAIIYETGQDSPAKRLTWRRYEVSIATGRDPRNGSTVHWTRSGDQVAPLIVPGRTSGSSGISRKIRLYEEDAQTSQPLSGDRTYTARFTVWATAANKKTYQYKYRLLIGRDDPANLTTYCTEKDGKFSYRLLLRQRPRARSDKREVKRDGLLFESLGPFDAYGQPIAVQEIATADAGP
jgi:hypothetical protein